VILSILIPTLATRRKFFSRLMDRLQPQRCPEVEILVDRDDGQRCIGEKRNRLVARAAGQWLVHIDDDDLVEGDYVPAVLEALGSNPDCVGYLVGRYANGQRFGTARHSLDVEKWGQRTVPRRADMEGVGPVHTFYTRTPMHINPIRTSIARQVPFQPLNFLEDHKFSLAVKPLLASEAFIDRVMYHYYFRTPDYRRGERTNNSSRGKLTGPPVEAAEEFRLA
jgi:hypothetical protein